MFSKIFSDNLKKIEEILNKRDENTKKCRAWG